MKEYLEELKFHIKKFKKSSEVSASEKYVYVRQNTWKKILI